MIKTGLPYDFETMQQIMQEGAIVDVTNISYPSIPKEDNVKTSLIYLRNTNFDNVHLDFQKADYNLKSEFLDCYFSGGSFPCKLKELSDTILHAIFKILNIDNKLETILTEQEETLYINSHKEQLNELIQLSISLPLFLINRLDNIDFEISFDDLEKSNDETCKDIINLIIDSPEFCLLYSKDLGMQPKFYEKLFTLDNNILFENICNHTPFQTLMFGIADEQNWNAFVNSIKEVINVL